MRKRKTNKIVLGVTGSFASGKSTVARLFKGPSAEIIDADIVAHQFLKSRTKTYQKLIKAFGASILNGKKEINRARLGGIVFSNRTALKKLNSIIHPQVIKEIKERIRKSSKKLVILDAAMIIEAGLRGIVDKLAVVRVRRELAVARAKDKFSLSEKQIIARMKSQCPQAVKEVFADFIIDNNGSLLKTKRQVAEIRRKLWKN